MTIYSDTILHFFFWRSKLMRVRAASFLTFLDYINWHTIIDRTPLDEGSARRRDLYLTIHRTHKRQPPMTSAWFETEIPARDRQRSLVFYVYSKGNCALKIKMCFCENAEIHITDTFLCVFIGAEGKMYMDGVTKCKVYKFQRLHTATTVLEMLMDRKCMWWKL